MLYTVLRDEKVTNRKFDEMKEKHENPYLILNEQEYKFMYNKCWLISVERERI